MKHVTIFVFCEKKSFEKPSRGESPLHWPLALYRQMSVEKKNRKLSGTEEARDTIRN